MINHKNSTAGLGTISHGTMRPEDLIPAFVAELERLDIEKHHVKLIDEANALDDYESETADFILEELFDALTDAAPPYLYFGTHPGDGSDFGFWLYEDFQEMMREDGVLEVSDLADIPAGYRGAALVISDHGNATFGYVDNGGGFVTTWAVV